jgi:hypothetical protein
MKQDKVQNKIKRRSVGKDEKYSQSIKEAAISVMKFLDNNNKRKCLHVTSRLVFISRIYNPVDKFTASGE